MKDSSSPISGGLANVSNRGWRRLGTDTTRRGRGRGTRQRTQDVWKWQRWGGRTSRSLAKGDCDGLGITGPVEAAPLGPVSILIFYLYAKAYGLSPTIAGFSRHNPDSLWHLDIVAFLSRKPETCPEGKARDWDFLQRQIYSPAKLVSPQTSKHSWAGGGGGPWQPSLWPPTFCHKRALSPTCWRLWRHTSAGRILWSKYQPEFT